MKKNNKGFFLAETIIIIALVTTVMAFVYPNVSKLYENYKLQVKYYDQPEDIFALKAIYETNSLSVIDEKTRADCDKITPTASEIGVKNLNVEGEISVSEYIIDLNTPFFKITDMNLQELYIVGYMAEPTSTDYNFNRYLKRMKKTTTDNPAYRLIGVFGSGSNTRYASIKIENPNPQRNCNL